MFFLLKLNIIDRIKLLKRRERPIMSNLLIKNAEEVYSKMALKGYNVKLLSSTVGVTNPYLSSILNGKRTPSPSLAKKIADSLSLEIGDIFYIKESCKS